MKKRIMRIFVTFPYDSKPTELKSDVDFIFNEDCYKWINNNDISQYKFIDITHEAIEYKLPVTDFKFMY